MKQYPRKTNKIGNTTKNSKIAPEKRKEAKKTKDRSPKKPKSSKKPEKSDEKTKYPKNP